MTPSLIKRRISGTNRTLPHRVAFAAGTSNREPRTFRIRLACAKHRPHRRIFFDLREDFFCSNASEPFPSSVLCTTGSSGRETRESPQVWTQERICRRNASSPGSCCLFQCLKLPFVQETFRWNRSLQTEPRLPRVSIRGIDVECNNRYPCFSGFPYDVIQRIRMSQIERSHRPRFGWLPQPVGLFSLAGRYPQFRRKSSLHSLNRNTPIPFLTALKKSSPTQRVTKRSFSLFVSLYSDNSYSLLTGRIGIRSILRIAFSTRFVNNYLLNSDKYLVTNIRMSMPKLAFYMAILTVLRALSLSESAYIAMKITAPRTNG